MFYRFCIWLDRWLHGDDLTPGGIRHKDNDHVREPSNEEEVMWDISMLDKMLDNHNDHFNSDH